MLCLGARLYCTAGPCVGLWDGCRWPVAPVAPMSHPPCGAMLVPVHWGDPQHPAASTHLWERSGLPLWEQQAVLGSTQGWWCLRVGSEVWHKLCPQRFQVAACELPALAFNRALLPPCLCLGALGKSSRSQCSGIKGRAGFSTKEVKR